jgi:hypothetical protein
VPLAGEDAFGERLHLERGGAVVREEEAHVARRRLHHHPFVGDAIVERAQEIRHGIGQLAIARRAIVQVHRHLVDRTLRRLDIGGESGPGEASADQTRHEPRLHASI